MDSGSKTTTKRERQIPKHDVDTLLLCIAGAWLFGTISGGRARELARSLGRTAADVENLKFAERAEVERDGRTIVEMLTGASVRMVPDGRGGQRPAFGPYDGGDVALS